MGAGDHERAIQTASDQRSAHQERAAAPGLRFAITRAQWFIEEARQLGMSIKDGKLTPEQADAKLEEIGALDLVYGRGP